MKKVLEKAYNNIQFLNSPDARSIRILSEFYEPLYRFRKQDIRDTIVFFGSARILSPVIARKQLRKLVLSINTINNQSRSYKAKIQRARIHVEMSQYYADAERLTFMLTQWAQKFDSRKHFVICSGGGPGIMEAANKGASNAGGKSIGLNISLPFEQEPNSYISKNLSFEFHYFFMRKFWFCYLAKALVMFPGGFGTFDELFEILTLIQTKKVKKVMPIVLYGSKYWNEVINFKSMLRHNTISRKDLRLFKVADTPEEAFSYLKRELTKIYKKNK